MLTAKQILDIAKAISDFPNTKEIWFDNVMGETGEVVTEFAILKGAPDLENKTSGETLTKIDITDDSICWDITE